MEVWGGGGVSIFRFFVVHFQVFYCFEACGLFFFVLLCLLSPSICGSGQFLGVCD